MTAHDKLAEALAGMTPGELLLPDGGGGSIYAARYEGLEIPGRIIAEPPELPSYARGAECDAWYAENARNMESLVALRNHAPAAIAEHAALLARVAELEEQLAEMTEAYWQIMLEGLTPEKLKAGRKAIGDMVTRVRAALGGAHD